MEKPFYFTIGLPLFYTPFMLFTGATTITNIDIPVSYFFSLVIMPLSFLLFMDIIRRYSKSVWLGAAAILLWLMIPKVFAAVELPKPASLLEIAGMFHSEYIYGCYQYVLHGFNPGSEPLSVFTVFLAIWLIGRLPAGKWRYILVAALYGYACMVRINNIWFAPLLAFLFWYEDKINLRRWSYVLLMLALSLLFFSLFFCPQLLVNYCEFGHLFSFPYVLHGQHINAGFEFGNLPRVADFYLRWHALPLALFIPALVLMRDKLLQRVMALWTIPLIIFFCGYNFAAEPYRFLMPVFWAMTAVVLGSSLLENTSWRLKVVFIVGLILLAIPELPVSFVVDAGNEPLCYILSPLLRKIYEWRIWYFIPLLLGLCLSMRKHRRIVFFLVAYAMLLCCPWPLFLCSIALILLYVVQDIIREYWDSLFRDGDSVDGTGLD